MMYGTEQLTPHTFQTWEFDGMIDEMLASHRGDENGSVSRTLLKGKDLTVVLTVLPQGHELHEHKASAPVMVVPLRGEAIFLLGDEEAKVSTSGNQVLALGQGKAHSVKATTDSAFLLIMGPLTRGSPG